MGPLHLQKVGPPPGLVGLSVVAAVVVGAVKCTFHMTTNTIYVFPELIISQLVRFRKFRSAHVIFC